MKIKRRRNRGSDDIKKSLSETEILEHSIDGINYKQVTTLKIQKTASFDLSSNVRMERLKKSLKADNSILIRAGLIALNTIDSNIAQGFVNSSKVVKGSQAHKLKQLRTAKDKRLINGFPANRTITLTKQDDDLLSKLRVKHDSENSGLFRAGLMALESLELPTSMAILQGIPKPKRGAPKKNK